MSQVLYRKYRPKLWSEITGQRHIVKTLTNEIAAGQTVHSYLFTGPRGIGKTTIARLFSKSLNCTGRGESPEPCGECGNCRALQAGNAMNIVEIDAASHTGVDNVRDKIIENARFAPSGAKYRIFIIDEAHMLSGAAWNALLKILEEPPAHIIFILATTELHKVPATIISRCQRFDFRKLSVKEIVSRLEKLAESEGVKTDKKIFEKIARLADGGLRDAESLFGQILSLGIKDITDEEADLVLPRTDAAAVEAFLGFLLEKKGREAALLLQNLSEAGVDFKHFADNVVESARQLLLAKMAGDAAFSAPLAEIIKILDVLIARRGDLRLLDIPSLPLELAAAEICGGDSHAVIARPKAEAISPASVISAEAEIRSGDVSEIAAKWPEVLERIKDYNHSLPFILKVSEPRSFDGKNLVLAVKFKLHKEKLEDKKNFSILTEVLKSVYNKDILITSAVDPLLKIEGAGGEDEIDVAGEFGAK